MSIFIGIIIIELMKIANKRVIDIPTWDRKEHYAFFGNMPDPFFGLTVKVDFTDCYRRANADGKSFFLYSLHGILKALNSIPEFRYRIEDGKVVQYDYVGASPTIAREDGSFGFAYFDWDEDLNNFVDAAMAEIARVKEGSGLSINENEGRNDIIYFTSIPWVDFSDIKHAGGHRIGDSIPEIAVGKLHEENGRMVMSVSIEVNHGLADGRHIGLFVDTLTNFF